jgi:F-type H+-transporting ATPase subunit b
MNDQIFIALAAEEKGGLFDFGATLPLVAIEFLLLMFILNIILYNPLTALINQRNEYILDNLSKASEMLTTSNDLTAEYETELRATKKQAQQEIVQSQKIHKQSFEIELKLSQKYIDTLLEKILGNFAKTKETIFAKLESDKVVDSLCDQMLSKLFTKQVVN